MGPGFVISNQFRKHFRYIQIPLDKSNLSAEDTLNYTLNTTGFDESSTKNDYPDIEDDRDLPESEHDDYNAKDDGSETVQENDAAPETNEVNKFL